MRFAPFRDFQTKLSVNMSNHQVTTNFSRASQGRHDVRMISNGIAFFPELLINTQLRIGYYPAFYRVQNYSSPQQLRCRWAENRILPESGARATARHGSQHSDRPQSPYHPPFTPI